MSRVVDSLVGKTEDIKLERERARRIERAGKDFGFFCRTYLSDYFYTDPAEYQRILYDVADTRSLSQSLVERIKLFVREKYWPLLRPTEHLAGALFIEPREHGKTVRWSFAYPLWQVLTGKSRYVLLIGSSQTAAQENLINIRTELEENEQILADFGDLRGDRWSDARIELVNGSCIQAKGSGASMRGTRFRQYRPDLIILDDILKDDAVESPTTRAKIHRWLKRVVFNLGKTAFIVWVNTIFHSDDPASRLLHELEEGTLKRWAAVRLSVYKPDGTPLWPENWSAELLEEKRQTLGSDVFSTEYENEPLSDEERIIKHEWIRAHIYVPAELPAGLRYFAGVDPAAGKHDHTAIVSVGVDRAGIIWEVDSWAATCSEDETVTQLITKHKRFKYALIAWEEVSFTNIYARYVMRMAAAENVYLPIKTVKAGTESKVLRVRSLSPLIENGLIRLRDRGNRELIEELTSFPKGRFDDLPDALAYAVHIITRSADTPQVVPIRRMAPTIAQQTLRGYRR
jgi:predicted phage terminase large subunit-like protein